MKNILSLLLFICLSATSFSQNNISVYGAFGYQDYRGDRGNGIWDHQRCVFGAGHLGLDYGITKSFDVKLHFSGGHMGYLQTQKTKELMTELAEWEEYYYLTSDGGDDHDHIEELEDLSAGMFSVNLNLQFKLANGYLMPLESKIQPTVYLGFGYNRIWDVMGMECVNVGNYGTINTGLSIPYYFIPKMYVAYNLDMGFFTSDRLDFVDSGRNDMHMQNSLAIGFKIR